MLFIAGLFCCLGVCLVVLGIEPGPPILGKQYTIDLLPGLGAVLDRAMVSLCADVLVESHSCPQKAFPLLFFVH